MAKKGELFPSEKRSAQADGPGTVADDEYLERRLHNAGGAKTDQIPADAFIRDALTWKPDRGGASVHRSAHVRGAVGGLRGARDTIKARTGDIREQVDKAGDRKWRVDPLPTQEDPSHAEIYRDPPGAKPTGADKDAFVAVWQNTVQALRECRAKWPGGRASVSAIGRGGVRLKWKTDHGPTTTIGQVETIEEAVAALVSADIITAAQADTEKKRLSDEWRRQEAVKRKAGGPGHP